MPRSSARYLRSIAERAGVIRLERKVVSATRREDGFIEELQFEDGGKLRRRPVSSTARGARGSSSARFSISLTKAGSTGCPAIASCMPPARSKRSARRMSRNGARASGWQWRIPLQQNLSHGQVYSSAHQSDEDALQDLLATIGGEPLGEPPRLQEFNAGQAPEILGQERRGCSGSPLAFSSRSRATDLHLADQRIVQSARSLSGQAV